MNTNQISRNERNLRRKGGSRRGRLFAGLLLLMIGALLLMRNLDIIEVPYWLLSWPVAIIAIGVIGGFRRNFAPGFWMLPVLIGALLLANITNPELRVKRFIAPAVIITVGLVFLLKPKKGFENCNERYAMNSGTNPEPGGTDYDQHVEKNDFIDVTSVFGGVKKNVMTKSFKGGEVVSFMGGSEINLTQADFTGRIVIDATNIMGGTKLIVPPTWDVQSDITAIFGGVDDKRSVHGVTVDPNKVLILDGVCVFGGIEIRSY